MNRTDSEIEGYVKDELQWSPDLDSGDIAVSVKQGVVTLTGFVRSYLDKYEAEEAAKRVAGVTAVANDIEVRLPGVDQRPDPEIARDAVASIKTQLPVSWEKIKAVIKDGWMTLEGEVEWQYQRVTAEQAVRGVKGVKGVSNLIKLKPRVQPSLQVVAGRCECGQRSAGERGGDQACGQNESFRLRVHDVRPLVLGRGGAAFPIAE